jgi:hypothetical protein
MHMEIFARYGCLVVLLSSIHGKTGSLLRLKGKQGTMTPMMLYVGTLY